MSARSVSTRETAKVIAASGRLRNEHFLLAADHLLLEVDPGTFDLVSAIAEGNIEVHMAVPEPYREYVIFAQSAVFRPDEQHLSLNGSIGARINGVDCPPDTAFREVRVPTDGTFVLPPLPEQEGQRPPSRIKRFARRLQTWTTAREPRSGLLWAQSNFFKCIIARAWKTL